MGKKKTRKKLSGEFGKLPDLTYFDGDMGKISAYFDHRWDKDMDGFLIDDITASDLDLDKVFRHLNNCGSTSGEQYFYYMLRSPCTEQTGYSKRRNLINFMDEFPEKRLDLQMFFSRLGRNRKADVSNAFKPKDIKSCMFFVYILLSLCFVASAVCFAALRSSFFGSALAICLFLNVMVHEMMTRKISTDLATINYSVGMVFASKSIKKLLGNDLYDWLAPMYEAAGKLKSLLRIGMVSLEPTGTIEDFINAVLLFDLISYEFLKFKLGSNHKDIFTLHENIGMLDAAISVSSYRAYLERWCEPDIDFTTNKKAYISGSNLFHPLIKNPVPNSLEASAPLLVTGSNASGKSTYLKTIALSALLSQSICTCPGDSYRATAFRIFSSMAIRDDLLAGESYYIAEIKSLKRILDYIETGENVLCVVDEVLRGTNTIERIAASSEVLNALNRKNTICIAATHDLELCTLLSGVYSLAHFKESVSGNDITFNYMANPGPATSRNAIKLLSMMGFNQSIVDGADMRAQNYMTTGKWEF